MTPSAVATADRLQGRRPVSCRVRPQGDHARRARDARPDVDPPRVRRCPAAEGRAHHRLTAHDHPDGGADRDADIARRRGALVQLQHLLHPGSRRGRGRCRPRGHPRGSPRHSRVRMEGRDARGVLVVHRAGAQLAGCGRGRLGRAEHDPRRRRRRDTARAQGNRVREGRRGARPRERGLRGARRDPVRAHALAGGGPAALDADRRGHQRRDRGDHHGRAPAV